MGEKVSLLVGTDICIDYFNHQLYRELFERGQCIVYYSVVTKKELFAKEGLSDTERRAIHHFLHAHRLVPIDRRIVNQYSELRQRYRQIAKEDCLIAATAIVKHLPLVTRNHRHFRMIRELVLY